MPTAQASHVWIAKGVVKSTWTLTNSATVGSVLDAPHLPDKTVTIRGTFAGASCAIVGSNAAATVSVYHTLNDSRGEGNPLGFTAADTRTILENPLGLRPRLGLASGNTSLIVEIVSQSGKR